MQRAFCKIIMITLLLLFWDLAESVNSQFGPPYLGSSNGSLQHIPHRNIMHLLDSWRSWHFSIQYYSRLRTLEFSLKAGNATSDDQEQPGTDTRDTAFTGIFENAIALGSSLISVL